MRFDWFVGVEKGFHAGLVRSGTEGLVRAGDSLALLALDEVDQDGIKRASRLYESKWDRPCLQRQWWIYGKERIAKAEQAMN